MNKFYFESREFGVSDNGIHLLRSGYNYETIEFSQVDTLTIERGKELNNWIAILVIGLGLLTSAVYYVWRAFDVVGNNEINVISVEQILVPLVPLMLGSYCAYTSLRNGTVLRLRTVKNKSGKFSLREFEKENKLGPLQNFLAEKLHTKVRIKV